jgi:hypothetical protein
VFGAIQIGIATDGARRWTISEPSAPRWPAAATRRARRCERGAPPARRRKSTPPKRSYFVMAQAAPGCAQAAAQELPDRGDRFTPLSMSLAGKPRAKHMAPHLPNTLPWLLSCLARGFKRRSAARSTPEACRPRPPTIWTCVVGPARRATRVGPRSARWTSNTNSTIATVAISACILTVPLFGLSCAANEAFTWRRKTGGEL